LGYTVLNHAAKFQRELDNTGLWDPEWPYHLRPSGADEQVDLDSVMESAGHVFHGPTLCDLPNDPPVRPEWPQTGDLIVVCKFTIPLYCSMPINWDELQANQAEL